MNGFLPLILIFSLPFLIYGQESHGVVPQDFTKVANRWMLSADTDKRNAAYLSWKQMGADAMPQYQRTLEFALQQHNKALEEAVRGRSSVINPYTSHHELAGKLDTERKRVMGLIMTDWEKDGKKVQMLREEMDDLEKLRERVNRLAGPSTERFDALVDATLEGLAEVTRELEQFDDSLESASIEDGNLRDFLLEENSEGKNLLMQRKRLATTINEVKIHIEAAKAHSDLGRWASSAMKDFANLLNKERALLGLPPRIMEEKLSDACKGHSSDMAKLGFFAHESPVTKKKSPWDRARLAGFAGNGSGENIFMGSKSHIAAYGGWFGSDGHRFIMFGGGDTLGVGISGIHWTMMTGNSMK